MGGLTGTIRKQSKTTVAPATTLFHWQDPSLNTESSRGEKTTCLLLCARGTRFEPRPDQLPQRFSTAFLTVQFLQSWPRRSIASGHPKKKCKKLNKMIWRQTTTTAQWLNGQSVSLGSPGTLVQVPGLPSVTKPSSLAFISWVTSNINITLNPFFSA